MITAFTVKNFKAIGDEPVRIELKPITLLFGANSAGKSSILHALHYAYEVFVNRNLNLEIITLGENNSLNLGGFKRFVHNGDYLNHNVLLRFEIDLTFNSGSLKSSCASGIINPIKLLSSATTGYVELEISWSRITCLPYVSRYETGINDERIAVIRAYADGVHVAMRYFNTAHSIFNDYWVENRSTLDYLVDKIVNPSLSLNEDNFHLRLSQSDALPYSWTHELEFEGISDGGIINNGMLEIDPDLELISKDFKTLLNKILVLPGKRVLDSLKSACYLGPLREIPPRYFSMSDSDILPDNTSLRRWATGLGAWDTLYSIGQKQFYELHELASVNSNWTTQDEIDRWYDDQGFDPDGTIPHPDELNLEMKRQEKRESKEELDIINNWLASDQRLNTGYQIEIEHYREIPLQLLQKVLVASQPLANMPDLTEEIGRLPEKIRIWLKDKRGLKLTPHEIGVGISQVLPVVVAAVCSDAQLVAIEQPELHIHPALQVQLGDLFIEQSKGRKKFFLIETHSEHLLLRILRRIRETAEELAPDEVKLSRNVAIYYVESENGSTVVNRIGLNESGRFTDRWPRGFFEEREKEYFGDQEDISDELRRLFGE